MLTLQSCTSTPCEQPGLTAFEALSSEAMLGDTLLVLREIRDFVGLYLFSTYTISLRANLQCSSAQCSQHCTCNHQISPRVSMCYQTPVFLVHKIFPVFPKCPFLIFKHYVVYGQFWLTLACLSWRWAFPGDDSANQPTNSLKMDELFCKSACSSPLMTKKA